MMNYDNGTQSNNYANMTIREELQARFDELNRRQSKNGLVNDFANKYSNLLEKGANIYNDVENVSYDLTQRALNKKWADPSFDNKSSMGLALNEASRISPLNFSDVNKHRYISCVGANDGYASAVATLAGGILVKEGKDLYSKLRNEKNDPRYRNKFGVVGDSLKDIGNDIIGTVYGVTADSVNDCSIFLPNWARR